MNGPDHYREAEKIMRLAVAVIEEFPNSDRIPTLAALAQVHATLALAAATAELDTYGDMVGRSFTQAEAWGNAWKGSDDV